MDVINFAIAILLGALIGLQREYEQHRTHILRFAGIRTFTLISLFGAILGFLSKNVFGSYMIAVAGLIIVSLLALASYYLTYLKYKDNTSTTEFAAILTFILGLMCTVGYLKEAIVLGIVIVAFLTYKEKMHDFANKIKKKELFAIVGFAIISLVVLPLLPKKEFSLLDIPVLRDVLLYMNFNQEILEELTLFNPYTLWLMVILVAGISFLGYILVKFLGAKRGYGLTGFVGGLVSSTAVTLSMSDESKRNKKIVNPFVIAVVVASATSYIRILLEVLIINHRLVSMILIPLGLMGLVGYLSAFYMYTRVEKKRKVKEIEFKQPFNIFTALKFVLFFAFIIFIAKLAYLIAGSTGIYIASILSGLADVDAITLTMSSLNKMGEVSSRIAVTSIILAASSNTLAKAGMAWFFGERKFAFYISIIFLLILAVGLSSVFLFF